MALFQGQRATVHGPTVTDRQETRSCVGRKGLASGVHGATSNFVVSKPKSERPRHDIVTLADLTPRQEVRGGARRRVFGAVDANVRKATGTTAPAQNQKPPRARKNRG